MGFAVFRITDDQQQQRRRLRHQRRLRGHERLQPAPRSGGAVGALELAERARQQPTPGGAQRADPTLREAHAMEMEYKDPSKRGRWIVLLGVVLAVVAGGAAFFLINNAQQQAGQSGLKTRSPSSWPCGRSRRASRSRPRTSSCATSRSTGRTPRASSAIRQGGRARSRPSRSRRASCVTTNLLASTTTGGRVLDPRPGRDRRPRFRGVARRVADGDRRPRGRRHARPGHARSTCS